jgi:hypothetical protein
MLNASDDFDLDVIGLSPEFSKRVLGAAGASSYRGPQDLRLTAEQAAMLAPYCQPHSVHQDAIGHSIKPWDISRGVVESVTAAGNQVRNRVKLAPTGAFLYVCDFGSSSIRSIRLK